MLLKLPAQERLEEVAERTEFGGRLVVPLFEPGDQLGQPRQERDEPFGGPTLVADDLVEPCGDGV